VRVPIFCSRCGNSFFDMCEPCGNVALLYSAWVLQQAQAQTEAEEAEAEAEYLAYQLENSLSPELDEYDLRNGMGL
jgi:hypothetical protein